MTDLSALVGDPPPGRGIFCNRTLNLRAIKAIGYDMDYTLIHYHVREWERRAYEHTRATLAARGWPVGDLVFDADAVLRGLVVDSELGNVVKTNRFGYVKQVWHGMHRLDFHTQRRHYARAVVDLSDSRWVFLNTFFAISEGCLYLQLVDLLDARKLPGTLGYADLYRTVRRALDAAHMEGALKQEILSDPERFVDLDPELPAALLDQKLAGGKKLLLITNSEWSYTRPIMEYAIDRYLPDGKGWRDLFDVVIVSARKPSFFAGRQPAYEVIGEPDVLRPVTGGLEDGKIYYGGHAGMVEKYLRVHGQDILYVGDHVYGDVHQSKRVRRWRTAIVIRELEAELKALDTIREAQQRLTQLMDEKATLEVELARTVLQQRRTAMGYLGHRGDATSFDARISELKSALSHVDEEAGPLAIKVGETPNPRWGPLMRTGNDKSMMSRHVERHADIYMSRASNFLYATPFAYLRSNRGSLPHDDGR